MIDMYKFLKLKLTGVFDFSSTNVIVLYNPLSVVVATSTDFICFDVVEKGEGFVIQISTSNSNLCTKYLHIEYLEETDLKPFKNVPYVESYPLDYIEFIYPCSVKASRVSIGNNLYLKYDCGNFDLTNNFINIKYKSDLNLSHADTLEIVTGDNCLSCLEFSALHVRFPFMMDYIFDNHPAYSSLFVNRPKYFKSWVKRAGVNINNFQNIVLKREGASHDTDIIVFNAVSNDLVQICIVNHNNKSYVRISDNSSLGDCNYLSNDYNHSLDLDFKSIGSSLVSSFEYEGLKCTLYKLGVFNKIKFYVSHNNILDFTFNLKIIKNSLYNLDISSENDFLRRYMCYF